MSLSTRVGEIQPFRTESNRFIRSGHGLPRESKAHVLLGIEEIRRLDQVVQINAAEREPAEKNGIAEHHQGQRDSQRKSPDLVRSTSAVRHRLIHGTSSLASNLAGRMPVSSSDLTYRPCTTIWEKSANDMNNSSTSLSSDNRLLRMALSSALTITASKKASTDGLRPTSAFNARL